MPLPKRQPLPSKAPSSTTTDTRFSNFGSDAKYRLPGKRHSKTALDSRFSSLLTDPDFYTKSSVDKYGRKKEKDSGKKKLQRLYNLSDDEGEAGASADEEEDISEERAQKREQADKKVKKELAKVDIRGNDGGVSSSDESSSNEESEDEDEEVEAETELPAEGDVPMGDVTRRLAAVNLDWDHIRAVDIMAVANSFLPVGSKISSVVIYPSEFGMERLQREEIEGPPREIFSSTAEKAKDNITSLDKLAGDSSTGDSEPIESTGEEFDSKALRAYQLDRLRYYYAILTCSSASTAKSIYDNLDGREYLSSANFFDLRFVPDDTTFDTDPHDSCTSLPDAYKPNDFTTDALTHSKVKLTWDAEDTTRQEVQKRAFSRKEVDEQELQAYIGSDSDSDSEVTNALPDKAAALRAALGLGTSEFAPKQNAQNSKSGRDFKKPAGEMQVTFSAGLSANASKGSVFENEPILDETTLEKYVRKQRERKQKRKEKMAAKEAGIPEGDVVEKSEAKKDKKEAAAADFEDPWNDPFFADGPTANIDKSASKKSSKAKKRAEKEALEAAQATDRANLELLMVDDENTGVRHFDINEIVKSEKNKKKNKKYKKDIADVEDNFNIDTTDPRFAKLYESHEFAIDPTNPKFRPTSGMKALLEEGRRKRKYDRDDGGEGVEKKKVKGGEGEGEKDGDELRKLAARVKAKSRKV